MSDTTDACDFLRDQIVALEQELANVQEANSEWHELMNEYDVPFIKELIEFDSDYNVHDVEQALRNYDLDDLKDAYEKIENYGDPEELAEKVTELEDAERKIEEYGDPEEMANELQELKEQVESDTPEAPADGELLAELKDDVSRLNGECIEKGEEIVNLRIELAECQNMLAIVTSDRAAAKSLYEAVEFERTSQDAYIVQLKSDIASLDHALVRMSDELEKTYGSVPYKALYESLENELSTTKCNLSSLRVAYKVLLHQYFSECSGYDDVPSSKPDFLTDQAVTDVEGDPS